MPLIRDSHNQGLSDVTPAEYGVQYQSGGVIGSCAYFNAGSNTYINTKFNTNVGTSDFTLALWVKIPTKTSGSYFVVASSKTNSAASAGLGIYWNYTQKKFLWSTANGSTYQEIWMSAAVDNLVYDKWCHVIMVRDSSDPKHGYFYINGTRYELASTPSILNITTATPLHLARTTNGSYILQMYANDLRFYDHAISPKEAKELSRGLTCHYPMNQNGVEDSSDGILYDVSGYNNHLLDRTGNASKVLTYVDDSPRYSKATHYRWPVWNQSNESVTVRKFLPYPNITVNMWMRYQQSDWGNPISCTEGGGWNFEDLNGGIQFSINITGVGYKPANCGITHGNLDGNWHMFTGIYDSAAQKTKIYIDGVLKGETATGTSAAINYGNCPFCIGAEAYGASPQNPNFTGDLSDIRIYGTALSDADILELYNTPVSITNNGSVITQGEFMENASKSGVSVASTAVVTSKELTYRDDIVSFAKSGSLYSKDIIES